MKRAVATCYWCGEDFRYFQCTRPRRYCSGACEIQRIRAMRHARYEASKQHAAQNPPNAGR